MYYNNEISIINLSRLQCIVSVSVSVNNFSTNTCIGNIGKKWYRSISKFYTNFGWTTCPTKIGHVRTNTNFGRKMPTIISSTDHVQVNRLFRGMVSCQIGISQYSLYLQVSTGYLVPEFSSPLSYYNCACAKNLLSEGPFAGDKGVTTTQ